MSITALVERLDIYAHANHPPQTVRNSSPWLAARALERLEKERDEVRARIAELEAELASPAKWDHRSAKIIKRAAALIDSPEFKTNLDRALARAEAAEKRCKALEAALRQIMESTQEAKGQISPLDAWRIARAALAEGEQI